MSGAERWPRRLSRSASRRSSSRSLAKKPRLRAIPLGGLGEIGRNMMALEYDENIVVIDAGLMFPEEEMLGVDLVLPDVTYLVERKEKVLAFLLTHGHEDHVGSLPYILPKVSEPIYSRLLTLGFIKNKLREHKLAEEVDLREIKAGDVVELGPCKVESIDVAHRIPGTD